MYPRRDWPGRSPRPCCIPTIGIGAGAACDGQVLVTHDLVGLGGGYLPRFVRQYADISTTIVEAVGRYIADVQQGSFPNEQESYQ